MSWKDMAFNKSDSLNSRVEWVLAFVTTSLREGEHWIPNHEEGSRKTSPLIFPKNEWEFTDNKEKDVVESLDHLHSEGTWHLKRKKYR